MKKRHFKLIFGVILTLPFCAWSVGKTLDGVFVRSPAPTPTALPNTPTERAFQTRSLTLRQQLAAQDLPALDRWWRQRNIEDPHKYLLPVLLAQLSLPKEYDRPQLWPRLTQLNRDKPDLYHFRSIFDIRIFFDYRQQLPPELLADYRSMVDSDRARAWMDQGTENHMFMQRASGLALLDGSGFPNALPATTFTNEAWLRAELSKPLALLQTDHFCQLQIKTIKFFF
jgi:hypothetical protein